MVLLATEVILVVETLTRPINTMYYDNACKPLQSSLQHLESEKAILQMRSQPALTCMKIKASADVTLYCKQLAYACLCI